VDCRSPTGKRAGRDKSQRESMFHDHLPENFVTYRATYTLAGSFAIAASRTAIGSTTSLYHLFKGMRESRRINKRST